MIVLNINKKDNKQNKKELVSDLRFFITRKETSFECTHLGNKEPKSIRPAKIEFISFLIKNSFVRN